MTMWLFAFGVACGVVGLQLGVYLMSVSVRRWLRTMKVVSQGYESVHATLATWNKNNADAPRIELQESLAHQERARQHLLDAGRQELNRLTGLGLVRGAWRAMTDRHRGGRSTRP